MIRVKTLRGTLLEDDVEGAVGEAGAQRVLDDGTINFDMCIHYIYIYIYIYIITIISIARYRRRRSWCAARP